MRWIQKTQREKKKALLSHVNPEKTILIWNKCDLPQDHDDIANVPHQVEMSAKLSTGLEALKAAVENILWKHGRPDKSQVTLTNERHYTSLGTAIDHLKALMQGLQTEISCEFLSSDMRACLQKLSHICGTDVQEDILSAIFSKFCVGK